MIKQRRNSMRTKRYEALLEDDGLFDVAEDICTALNIVDHFTDGDKWEVVYEKGDDFVTVSNTSVDDQMDGLFCGVEIGNIWATCFAPPVREGGDYVVIGRWRWMLPDILDRITALVGCGADCALERRRNVRNRARRNERRNIVRRGRRFNESAEQDYVRRAQELEGLSGEALFSAVQVGDILQTYRMIPTFYIVKRKTAKRLVVHELEDVLNKNSDSVYNMVFGPEIPPKEVSNKSDVFARVDGAGFKVQMGFGLAYVWDGLNDDGSINENRSRH